MGWENVVRFRKICTPNGSEYWLDCVNKFVKVLLKWQNAVSIFFFYVKKNIPPIVPLLPLEDLNWNAKRRTAHAMHNQMIGSFFCPGYPITRQKVEPPGYTWPRVRAVAGTWQKSAYESICIGHRVSHRATVADKHRWRLLHTDWPTYRVGESVLSRTLPLPATTFTCTQLSDCISTAEAKYFSPERNLDDIFWVHTGSF